MWFCFRCECWFVFWVVFVWCFVVYGCGGESGREGGVGVVGGDGFVYDESEYLIFDEVLYFLI